MFILMCSLKFVIKFSGLNLVPLLGFQFIMGSEPNKSIVNNLCTAGKNIQFNNICSLQHNISIITNGVAFTQTYYRCILHNGVVTYELCRTKCLIILLYS